MLGIELILESIFGKGIPIILWGMEEKSREDK